MADTTRAQALFPEGIEQGPVRQKMNIRDGHVRQQSVIRHVGVQVLHFADLLGVSVGRGVEPCRRLLAGTTERTQEKAQCKTPHGTGSCAARANGRERTTADTTPTIEPLPIESAPPR